MSATTTRPARRPKARVVRLVRANQLITIRDLARKLGTSQAKALEQCEEEGLNVNIGIRVGNRIGEHDRIGDYTVEDLSV